MYTRSEANLRMLARAKEYGRAFEVHTADRNDPDSF